MESRPVVTNLWVRHAAFVRTSHGNAVIKQLHQVVTSEGKESERAFTTAWFTKAARKAHISDEELCAAIQRVRAGQADDLGGGVSKARLWKNQ